MSNQKPNVENINKQLRRFFPKKKSIDNFNKNKVKEINQILLNIPIKSLDGHNPKEAFIKVYKEDIYYKLFK